VPTTPPKLYETDPVIVLVPMEARSTESLCDFPQRGHLTVPILRPKTFIARHAAPYFQLLYDWLSRQKIPVIGTAGTAIQLMKWKPRLPRISPSPRWGRKKQQYIPLSCGRQNITPWRKTSALSVPTGRRPRASHAHARPPGQSRACLAKLFTLAAL